MAVNNAVPIINAVAGLIDDMNYSKEEKAAATLALFQAGQAVDLAQIAANAAGATNKSVFVAGWRPFIGWVCGAAFAWKFLILPLVNTSAFYTFAYFGVEVDLSGLPVINTAEMLPILGGMLGLGAYRSFDKTRGVAS